MYLYLLYSLTDLSGIGESGMEGSNFEIFQDLSHLVRIGYLYSSSIFQALDGLVQKAVNSRHFGTLDHLARVGYGI